MSITSDVTNWYRSKKARGAYVASLNVCDRSWTINERHADKLEIKKAIEALSGDTRLRHMLFQHFNRLEQNRRFLSHRPEHKGQQRRILSIVRSLRINNGVPTVFSGCKTPYWFDPKSKYLPDEDYSLACKAGIQFHKQYFLIQDMTAHRFTQKEMQRGHCGMWTVIDATTYDDIVQNKYKNDESPYLFAFESLTDMVEFRMTYEFERMEDAA